MGIFDFFRKDDDFVDLSKQSESEETLDIQSDKSEEKTPLDPNEKKRRFINRISEMMEKLENLSTKIYHIEQRLEVMERKLRVNSFRSE